MNEVWSNPAAWTTEQWMAVSIMAFVIIAILVMIHRLLTILKMSRKQTYKPNLRRLRKSSLSSNQSSTKNTDNGT